MVPAALLRWVGLGTLVVIPPADLSAARRVVGQLGGPISALDAQGDRAYVGMGSRLLLYDISDPASPREIGSTLAFADIVSSVMVAGTRAYVTAGTAGLHILDIADAANPRTLGRWDSPGSAEGVVVEGTRAYLADGPFGPQIVDVSNPSAPVPLASAFDMRFAFDVVVQGRYAFVAAAGAGLLVADVGDPTRPQEIAVLDTPGYARDLAISGSTVYLADQWGGVRLVSVADPSHPLETQAIPLPGWAFGVAVAGSMLYVADGSQGLRLIDVADQPRGVGSWEIPWKLSWKVAIADHRVLVAVRNDGVHVLDARNASRPELMGSPVSNAQAVAASGHLAFVATGGQGLRIVDFSDPTRPVERGRGGGRHGWAVLADENRVYICDGISPVDHHLRIFDVSDPDRPNQITSIQIRADGICRDLVRDQKWLYMPNEFGLVVYDMANPAAPVRVGAIQLPPHGVDATAGADSVAVAGSTAFVPNAIHGVKVLDVEDPRNMRVIGAWSYDPPREVKSVYFQNNLLYLLRGHPLGAIVGWRCAAPARTGASTR